MEQIISVLEKIRKIAATADLLSAIERDLMLHYTRELYETILASEGIPAASVQQGQELTEEPEPLPEEVVRDEARMEEEVLLPTPEEDDNEQEKMIPAEQEEEEVIPVVEEEHTDEPDDVQDEPDRSELYSDIAAQTEEEEEPLSPMIHFELEPELQEEKPVLFQPKHSTDFKIWNKDIRSYIGINDKYNFISELFRGNSEAYEEILNEINQCEDKQDALRFLDNAGITTLYHWQQEGFSEQIFYNVLSQFFAAR